MCRRNHLRGCLLLGIGIGILAGNSLESWIICTLAGLLLTGLGIMILKKY